MALRDKLRRVKRGGSLQATSEEELQQLSADAGRVSPPTSPLEAGVVGAEPDVAKMAGTGLQKAGALRQAIQGEQDLRDVLRRQQTRDVATEEEEERVRRGERLEGLGTLQGRVQQLSEQMVRQAAAGPGATAETALVLRDEAAELIPPEQQEEFRQRLTALNQDPSNFENLKAINNMLGITDINNMITAENLTERFLTTTEQAGQITAESLADQVSVTDLDVQQLGFDNIVELSSLLGIPEEELAGLNVRQLIEETEAQIQEEHQQVTDLQRRAADPNLGPAERAEARKQLREMGAVGIRKAESDIDELAEQIAEADTISFGGEQIAIGNMLEDEYLSGLTAAYLNAPEGDPLKERLKESEPELVEFIEKNKNVLDAAVAEIEEGVQDFAALQYRNQEVADTEIGKLGDDIMREIFPDWGELRTDSYNLQAVPILDILNDDTQPARKQESLFLSVKDMADADPSLVSQLAELTEGQLAQLGATDRQSDKWRSVQNYLDQYQRVRTMDANNPESVINAAFGPGVSPEQAQKLVKEMSVRERSGLFGESGLGKIKSEVLNIRNDQLGSTEEIASGLRSYLTEDGQAPIKLTNMLANQPPQIESKLQGLNQYNRQPSSTFDMIRYAFEEPGDREFGTNDVNVAAERFNKDNFEEMWSTNARNTMTAEARDMFKQAFNTKYYDNVREATVGGMSVGEMNDLGNISVNQANQSDYDRLRNAASQAESYYNSLDTQSQPLEKELAGRFMQLAKENFEAYKPKFEQRQHDIAYDKEAKEREKERKKKRELTRQLSYLAGAVPGQLYELDKALGSDASRTLRTAGKRLKQACFIEGTLFRLANGEVRRVEKLTPRDELFGGGETIATACFIGEEMYDYNGIKVSGSHAVYESNEGWLRVRDSAQSVRRPDLDGQPVYVVWNTNHRMIAADGTIFADYTEVDVPDDSDTRLEQLRKSQGAS